MSTADIITTYEKHLEANWTREGDKAPWGGYVAFTQAPKCMDCGGTGRKDYYADDEFTSPIMTDYCPRCRGYKCEFTPEVRKWINEDGTLNAN